MFDSNRRRLLASFAALPVLLVPRAWAQADATRPASRSRALQDLISPRRAQPGKISGGSTLNVTPQIAVELLAQRAGVTLQHVPYKASTQAQSDLLGGQMDFVSDSMPAIIGH